MSPKPSEPDLLTRFRADQPARLAASAAMSWPRRLVGKITGVFALVILLAICLVVVGLVGLLFWAAVTDPTVWKLLFAIGLIVVIGYGVSKQADWRK